MWVWRIANMWIFPLFLLSKWTLGIVLLLLLLLPFLHFLSLSTVFAAVFSSAICAFRIFETYWHVAKSDPIYTNEPWLLPFKFAYKKRSVFSTQRYTNDINRTQTIIKQILCKLEKNYNKMNGTFFSCIQ